MQIHRSHYFFLITDVFSIAIFQGYTNIMTAYIYGFNIGAPIDYAHSILHVGVHLSPYVAIPAISERNAVREVLRQWVGIFLWKCITALQKISGVFYASLIIVAFFLQKKSC